MQDARFGHGNKPAIARSLFLVRDLRLQNPPVTVRFYIWIFSAALSGYCRNSPNSFPEMRHPENRSG
jgi:hypothetical protein